MQIPAEAEQDDLIDVKATINRAHRVQRCPSAAAMRASSPGLGLSPHSRYAPHVSTSEHDREYMRRIGVYKALSHCEAQAEHLALPLDERLRRSWRLYVRYRPRLRDPGADDDPTPLYDRARERGLYEP